jgi:hypothetical protein
MSDRSDLAAEAFDAEALSTLREFPERRQASRRGRDDGGPGACRGDPGASPVVLMLVQGPSNRQVGQIDWLVSANSRAGRDRRRLTGLGVQMGLSRSGSGGYGDGLVEESLDGAWTSKPGWTIHR